MLYWPAHLYGMNNGNAPVSYYSRMWVEYYILVAELQPDGVEANTFRCDMNGAPPVSSPQALLRQPALDPDGRQLAFVAAGDVWLVAIHGGTAERLTAHPARHYRPRFSPDGRQLLFAAGRDGAGDLYLFDLDGGPPRQITFQDEPCYPEDWASDGEAVFFSCDIEQMGQAIYRVSICGGTPAPIYLEPYEQLDQAAISPDGQMLAFVNRRERWWRRGPHPFSPNAIWLGPTRPDYQALRELAGPFGERFTYAGKLGWPLWSPDGQGLYVVCDCDGHENLWYIPLYDGTPRQITFFRDGRLLFPTIARRSGTIVCERGDGQLWQIDPTSGEAAPIPIRVRIDTKRTPVQIEHWSSGFSEVRLSPDGKKVALVARGDVFADFADKETDRELRQGPAFRITNTPAREWSITWTPDSRNLIYLSDRNGEVDLFSYDFETGTEVQLTHDGFPKLLPRIAPDGKAIAYIRNRMAIDVLAAIGEQPRELCRARFTVAADLCWSPDSRYLAFIAQDDRLFSNVYIVPTTGGEPRQITFLSNLGGGDLSWSPDGSFIIFTTEQYRLEAQIARVDLRPPQPIFRETAFERLFKKVNEEKTIDNAGDQADSAARATNPVSVSIVYEGIERRLRLLTPPQMNATAGPISPNGKDLLFLASVAGKADVWTLPLDEPRADQPPRQLTANAARKGWLQFAPDGRSFYYLEDGQLVSRRFPGGNEPNRLTLRAEVEVDFHRAKEQIFTEAWRELRDSFYDPTFRGQDWQTVRERFAPLIRAAQTTEELHTLINLMAGELRASHLGSGFYGWSSEDGFIGVLFAVEPLLHEGRLIVERILPDGPAALADEPPRPGEELVAVDGVRLNATVSLQKLLLRSSGRRVRLALRAHDSSEREIIVRPVPATAYQRLRYRDWVVTNERYVHQISNGRLGYVHIEEMSYDAYQQFLVDLDAETHNKAGVVIDVRYNSGGYTATFVLDVLMRRSALRSGFRDLGVTDASHLAGNRVLDRPTILVTNERSASNTEMLSESYRRLRLGKVVGRPTAGAVIWTYRIQLLDGAWLSLPRFYVVTPEGEELEGRGRPVDIEVRRPLGEWASGRDCQLEAAVQTLLKVVQRRRR